MRSSSSKIVGTILKMDKGGIQTNGPEEKKVKDDTQRLTPKRLYRGTNCVKKRRMKRNCLQLKISWMHQYKDLRTSFKRAEKD